MLVLPPDWTLSLLVHVSQSLLSRQNAAEVFNWFLQAWAFSPCTRLPVSVRVHFKVFVIEVLHDWLLSDLLIPYIIPRTQWKLKGDLFSVCGTNCPPPTTSDLPHLLSHAKTSSRPTAFDMIWIWGVFHGQKGKSKFIYLLFLKRSFLLFLYILYIQLYKQLYCFDFYF